MCVTTSVALAFRTHPSSYSEHLLPRMRETAAVGRDMPAAVTSAVGRDVPAAVTESRLSFIPGLASLAAGC